MRNRLRLGTASSFRLSHRPRTMVIALAAMVISLTATPAKMPPPRGPGAVATSNAAPKVAHTAPTLSRVDRPQPAPASSLVAPIYGRAVGFAESQPLRNFPAEIVNAQVDDPYRFKILEPEFEHEGDEPRSVNELNSVGTGVEPDPMAPTQRDGALQRMLPLREGATILLPAMPAPSLTFEGLSAADNTTVFGTTVAPPDPTGAVGPNDYVQTTNNLVRIYDKNGVPRGPAFKLSGLFASLGGITPTQDKGDTIVLYDRMANRWMISQFAFTAANAPPYHQAIAVSKTSDPTGAYWVYDFVMPGVEFNDYFKFGAWPDAYYMTDRQFTNGGPFNSFGCFAFDRAKMLVGDPSAGFIYFNLGTPMPLLSNASSGMLPTDFTGLTPPPAGAPNVFAVYTDDAFTGDPADTVRLFNFHTDFATPASSTFTERPESPVAVAAFDSRNPSGRADIEEPAPAVAGDSLDSLGDRLMLRLQYLNRAGTESLLMTHTVNAGTLPAPGFLPTRAQYIAGVRYYEFRKTSPGGAFTVPEQATFSPDTNERWMASVAMDNAGNIAAGYNLSSTTVLPSLAFAGRLAGDPANGLAQGETIMFSGTGVQRGTSNRWGDYSSLQLDPSDDATFWYVNQYYASSPIAGFDWHTRIGRFSFPGATAPLQGTLSGTITACDSGLPLADAIVTVTSGPSTGFSATTMPNGAYSMNLLPGAYSVTVSNSTHTCLGAGPFLVTITASATTPFSTCLSGAPSFQYVSNAISGGNGNGMIERDECNDMAVTIRNNGCQTGTGITGVLSTSTPNVTIIQPSSPFADLNENATGANTVKFAISTSAAFVAGTPINLTLTVTASTGSPSVLSFTVPTNVAPPLTVSGTIAPGDLTFTGLRITRNGIASTCGSPKACPGQATLPSGTRAYDAYTFTNAGGVATCATVNLTNTCGNNVFGICYSGSFNPANLCTNYLADPGTSASSVSWSFTVPAGGTFVLVVYEVTPGAGCTGYSATVSGLFTNNSGGGACAADLSITNTPSPSPTVGPGQNLTFTYVTNNNGPTTAYNEVINTSTPPGTTFVSASASAGGVLATPGVGGTGPVSGTWAGSTANGASHTMSLVVNVPLATAEGTVISNTATTTSATADPNPGNNSATASVTVSQADLSLTDVATPSPTVYQGETLSFTMASTDNGTGAAQDLAISTTTPASTTFLSATGSAGVVLAPNGPGALTGTWPGATGVGATRTLNMLVNVLTTTPPGTIITDSASTSSTVFDPNLADNSASASVTVLAARNETEPNNSYSTATPVTAPGMCIGRINPANDLDYWRIVLPQGSTLTATLTPPNPPGNQSYFIYIYNQAGQIVAQSTRAGGAVNIAYIRNNGTSPFYYYVVVRCPVGVFNANSYRLNLNW